MSIPRFQNVPDINKSGMTFENYLKQIRLLKYSLPQMYDKYFYMIHDFYLEEFSKIEAGKAFQDENYNKSQYDDLIYSLLDLFTSNFVQNSFLLYTNDDEPDDYMGRIMSVMDMLTNNILNGIKQADLPDWAISNFLEYFMIKSDFNYNMITDNPLETDDLLFNLEIAKEHISEGMNEINRLFTARSRYINLNKSEIPLHFQDYYQYISNIHIDNFYSYILSDILSNISLINFEALFKSTSLNTSIILNINKKLNYADVREPAFSEYQKQKDIVDVLYDYVFNYYDNNLPMITDKLNSFIGLNALDNYQMNNLLNKIIKPFVDSIPRLLWHYQRVYRGGTANPNDSQTVFYKTLNEIIKNTTFRFIPGSIEEQKNNNEIIEKMGAMLLANYFIVNTGDIPSINSISDPYQYLAEQGNFVSRLQKSGYTIIPYTPPTN